MIGRGCRSAGIAHGYIYSHDAYALEGDDITKLLKERDQMNVDDGPTIVRKAIKWIEDASSELVKNERRKAAFQRLRNKAW